MSDNRCRQHHFGTNGRCIICKVSHRFWITAKIRWEYALKAGDKFGDMYEMKAKVFCRNHYDANHNLVSDNEPSEEKEPK